jgi:hypothetical protein
MTSERRKCTVREAPQRRLLLDNGSLTRVSIATDKLVKTTPLLRNLHTIPQQRINTDNRRTLRGGDLNSVRHKIIKKGHAWRRVSPHMEGTVTFKLESRQ